MFALFDLLMVYNTGSGAIIHVLIAHLKIMEEENVLVNKYKVKIEVDMR